MEEVRELARGADAGAAGAVVLRGEACFLVFHFWARGRERKRGEGEKITATKCKATTILFYINQPTKRPNTTKK